MLQFECNCCILVTFSLLFSGVVIMEASLSRTPGILLHLALTAIVLTSNTGPGAPKPMTHIEDHTHLPDSLVVTTTQVKPKSGSGTQA